MLPKQFRLPGNKINQVKSKGKAIFTPIFILLHTPSTIMQSKIGFIVSSKVSKKAVTRNHIKRLLREATRPHLNLLPSQTNIVIIAKKTILNKKFNTISKYLEKAFNQTH